MGGGAGGCGVMDICLYLCLNSDAKLGIEVHRKNLRRRIYTWTAKLHRREAICLLSLAFHVRCPVFLDSPAHQTQQNMGDFR